MLFNEIGWEFDLQNVHFQSKSIVVILIGIRS